MPRRALLAGVVAAPLQMPTPANAVFGLFEDNFVKAIVFNAFNVSAPKEYKLLGKDKDYIKWRDRVQVDEEMTAAGKIVPYKSLAESPLGKNVTLAGERLALKRFGGNTSLVEALVDPDFTGNDIWMFEFENDQVHQLELLAVVQRPTGENVLCNVALRTPALVWIDRKDLFKQILSTFKPLVSTASPPVVAKA